MTQTRRLATSFARNRSLTGADGREVPVVTLPASYVTALSAVVLFGIASAAWWAWFVSRGLTVAYVEGFRNVRVSEE